LALSWMAWSLAVEDDVHLNGSGEHVGAGAGTAITPQVS
jgi:hypothetical protein